MRHFQFSRTLKLVPRPALQHETANRLISFRVGLFGSKNGCNYLIWEKENLNDHGRLFDCLYGLGIAFAFWSVYYRQIVGGLDHRCCSAIFSEFTTRKQGNFNTYA